MDFYKLLPLSIAIWLFVAPAKSSGQNSVSSNASLGTPTTFHPVAQQQPAPAEGSDTDNTVYLLNADLLRLGNNDSATLTGDIEVRYRRFTLRSDSAFIDTKNKIARFSGRVGIVSNDGTTAIVSNSPDSQIILDTDQGTYSFKGPSDAVLSTNDLNGSGLIQPLLVKSDEFEQKGGILDARNSGFTTCDFAMPHYYFGVRSLTIYPGKKLIARHAILFRRGVRVLELPYVWLPLNDRYSKASYLPTVGQDPQDGYFMKFAYPYVLSDAALGLLRLDLMQYRGVGTGFDQSYDAHGPGGGGTLSVYSLQDKQQDDSVLTSSLQHHQSIGSFQLGINSQFENNSFLSSLGQSQSMTNQVTLTQTSKSSSTAVSGNFQQSNFGSGPTSNISASLNQQNNIGHNATANIKMNFSGFVSPGETIGALQTPSQIRESLASSLALHLQPNGLKVDIESDLFTPLQNTSGGSLASTAGLLREPELLLSSTGHGGDPLNLLARIVHGSQVQLGIGMYDESSSNTSTSRINFIYDEGVHTRHIGRVFTTSTAGFNQSFYGDGGAQYSYFEHLNTETKDGPVDFSAGYNTLRVSGFTPFLFDRTGETNNASLNATIHPNHRLDFTATSSYDFLHDRSVNGLPAAPWANLLGVLNYHPTGNYTNRLQGTYDPNHGRLFDISDDSDLKSAWGMDFHVSTDYLPQSHKVGTINGTLDLPIIVDKREQAGYRIQAIAGYNGFNDKFTYQGVSLTRSWHDWDMTMTYQYTPSGLTPGNTFSFTFHLKALPGFQPFGIGSYGQSLSGGIGQVY